MDTQPRTDSIILRFFDGFLQEKNIKWVLATGMLILLGSSVMNLIARHWSIADKGAFRFTFPADNPEREIDFIAYRPADRFTIVESRVIPEKVASDHRPVLLVLELRTSNTQH